MSSCWLVGWLVCTYVPWIRALITCVLFYSCVCLFVSQVPGFEVDVAWSALRRDAFEGEPPGDKGVGKVSQSVSLSVSYSRERERERDTVAQHPSTRRAV